MRSSSSRLGVDAFGGEFLEKVMVCEVLRSLKSETLLKVVMYLALVIIVSQYVIDKAVIRFVFYEMKEAGMA
jgi:hypothetical protein